MTIALKKALAICMCLAIIFASFAGCNFEEAEEKRENVDFYINGQSEDGHVTFGVAGKGNLFEPGHQVKVIIDCQNKDFDGKTASVSISSLQTGFKMTEQVKLTNGSQSSLEFSSDKNGIFTVNIKLPDNKHSSFNVGVMPKNQQASDEFYYGIQPYITRSYTWGEGFCLPNYDAEQSIDLILDAAEYMGVNLVREDNVSWGAMQSGPYASVDLSQQDYIINKINGRGMKANIIFGFNAGEWSAANRFKGNYDQSKGWTYMPNLNIWQDYVTKVADHYKNNNNILWEIWNEPNWEPFFTGTKEEYFELLESTAKTLKKSNPSAYVFSGGLAVAERESNLPYYQKAAQLMAAGVLDSYGYHNHDGYNTYYDNMQLMLNVTDKAGLSTGGINSESGVYGGNAGLLACKALYTRASGGKGFVSFSFRSTVTPENDINEYAFFNEYLQPTESALSYATVIRFLGNAKFEESLSAQKSLQIDRYSQSGKKILVYYSMGNPSKAKLPQGKFTAYDKFGNELDLGDSIAVSTSPIYLIFE